MFRRTGGDVAVSTDGYFALEETDAPRTVWYCNSVPRDELQMLSRPPGRLPWNALRMRRIKRRIREKIALARSERVVIVSNSEHTRREMSAAIGREAPGPVVYPPVDLRRFSALREARGAEREPRTATVARFSPEKNLGEAVRIMRAAGGRYDMVGGAVDALQLETLEALRRSASGEMRLRADAGQDAIEDAVGGAKVYLQTSRETFGMSVVEAIAAGCVPVVPDNSAHPETVPFAELRYGSEDEAAGIVRDALDGKHDGLLPGLQEHVRRFSVEAFQDAMIRIVEGRNA